jgi:hypothetical protein
MNQTLTERSVVIAEDYLSRFSDMLGHRERVILKAPDVIITPAPGFGLWIARVASMSAGMSMHINRLSGEVIN